MSSARLLLLLVAVTPGHLFTEKLASSDAPAAVRLADDAELVAAARVDAVKPAVARAAVRTPRPVRVPALVIVALAPAPVTMPSPSPTEPGAARGPPIA